MLLQIGQEYDGGIVFALSADRRTGLMVTPNHLEPEKDLGWGKGKIDTNFAEDTAMKWVHDCKIGGHTDWYLPTKSELVSIWYTLFKAGKGNFPTNENYVCLSSSSKSPLGSLPLNRVQVGFNSTNTYNSNNEPDFSGSRTPYVRAVRAFSVPVTAQEYVQIGFKPEDLSASTQKIGSAYNYGKNTFIFDISNQPVPNSTNKFGFVFSTEWIGLSADYNSAYSRLSKYSYSPDWYLPSIGQLELLYRNCYVHGNMKSMGNDGQMKNSWDGWLREVDGPRIFWSNSKAGTDNLTYWALDFETGVKFAADGYNAGSPNNFRYTPVAEVNDISPY
ncbi:MAG: hypothetical protein H6563_11195 [Lewinellaceae bacterium]|nr:hypothetical protein [Lewinellaceae bacterium]